MGVVCYTGIILLKVNYTLTSISSGESVLSVIQTHKTYILTPLGLTGALYSGSGEGSAYAVDSIAIISCSRDIILYDDNQLGLSKVLTVHHLWTRIQKG